MAILLDRSLQQGVFKVEFICINIQSRIIVLFAYMHAPSINSFNMCWDVTHYFVPYIFVVTFNRVLTAGNGLFIVSTTVYTSFV